MADEYTWYGDAALDARGLRDFIATSTGGVQHRDGTIFLPGMYVTARPAAGDEVNPAVRLFGFDHRFTATFRVSSRVDEATARHAEALMVHTLIAFSTRYGGHGVLLFNGETAVLQYADHGVVLAADWEGWSENGEIAPLLTQFASQVLPQPLL
jgi:hypothetical protein